MRIRRRENLKSHLGGRLIHLSDILRWLERDEDEKVDAVEISLYSSIIPKRDEPAGPR
jgi:hypothetical protein